MRKRELPKQVRILSRITGNKQQSDSDRQVIRGEASFTLRLSWVPFRTREIIRSHRCIYCRSKNPSPSIIQPTTALVLSPSTISLEPSDARPHQRLDLYRSDQVPSTWKHSQRVDTLPYVAVPPMHGVNPLLPDGSTAYPRHWLA